LFGANIRLARRRRKLTTLQIAERAGINRSTLVKREKCDPTVAVGIYVNVLLALNLHTNFL
jgi:transcriptional regulator with XRE-family HTH domain